ncbi:MAG: hypothetical protein GC178_00680 [Flavobacteriales bacterium]|nr:hypothetical protein [Flavobacteriales bacterium]
MKHITYLTLGMLTGSLFILNGCKKDSNDTSCGGDGILCNVAGVAEQSGGGGNGGDALQAFLYWPMDVAEDTDGNIIVVDFNNHCVRKIDENGVINVIIGSGVLGDDPTGQALDINLNHPTCLTIGPDGNYWLSAWHNWKVKHIDHATGVVTSPIGTSQGLLGDGGPANAAKLDLPSCTVFDSQGNAYVTDQANQRIRKVDVNNIITTFVGGDEGFADGVGGAAQFSLPRGSNAGPGGKIDISNDKSSWLVMADTKNNRVRKIDLSTGEVTTIAGTGDQGYSGDGGPATSAQLYWPTDVAVGPNNVIYVADSKNNVIRKIDTDGTISTVAGSGALGHSDNGTKATQASLNKPTGVFVSSTGVLYIADTYNHQVKRVSNP